jgi:flagellar hook assembly protein FlgD
LRKIPAALALVALLGLGVIVPSVGAAVGDPKVVIIVGATHSVTPTYRSDADVIYTEARKYTSNVVKVYSPNATWAAVQNAVVGASVVVYLGHGNGWPSPYTYDPNYTTKDGFGLNATAGNGDYNNQYYGEPYVASLKLAPGAIVILNHLCYASGNSEPGNPQPSVAVARQRADNYAAGFLKAGASAVLAEGLNGAERYMRDLFTTHQTLEQMWRTESIANGNFVNFPSTRTPGATVYQDPETPTSGFYRSLTVKTFGVTTDEVTSAGYGDTSVNPTTLMVPGNAQVTVADAPLYGDLTNVGTPSSTVPAGTRLRLIETATQTTADGGPLIEVQGIDDPSITGFMDATDLAPRDSTPPVVRAIDVGVGRFSPNGDGQGDTIPVQARFTEPVAWTAQISNGGGTVLWQQTGSGAIFGTQWDGLVNGVAVPDGTYTLTVSGVDPWGNGPGTSTRTIVVDTVAPTLDSLTPDVDPTAWFSPNGDGWRDAIGWTGENSESGNLRVQVKDAQNTVVRSFSVTNGSVPEPFTWDGRTNAGAYAPDGVYTVSVAPVDLAGNIGPAVDRPVKLIGALKGVVVSVPLFFPQDGDNLAQTAFLKFTLNRPMTVTWTLRNATNQTVITRLNTGLRPAGSYGWTFNGRLPDGTMLPRGKYTSYVLATDGTLTVAQAVSFVMDAFKITPSDTTPGRGQSITVTVNSAETLARNPTLWVTQPGVAAWSVGTTKVGTNTYRATLRLKSGGAGTVEFRAWGVDKNGVAQQTRTKFPLH